MSEFLQRRSLADLAVDALLQLIERRGLRAGDALPSTAELAATLDVSRNVVREAIAELAGQGLLLRRQGRETMIALPDARQLERLLRLRFAVNGADYEGLEEYREIIEIGCARLAAARANDANVNALVAQMEQLRMASTEEELFEADQAFHVEIAKVAGNEMLLLAVESTNALLIELRRRSWAGWIGSGHGADVVVEAHQAILDRILDGDGDGAAEAMRVNMNQAQVGLASARPL